MYELTTHDIALYLQALEMQETCGIGQDPDSCLAARTLRWKYGRTFVVASLHFWPAGREESEEGFLTEDVLKVVKLFDSFGNKPVTRAAFESALTSTGVKL